MASIEPRKNKKGEITSFRITVSLGYDEEGKAIRERTSFKPNATTPKKMLKEAELFALDFERRVLTGDVCTSGDKLSFKDLVKYWEENCLDQKVLSNRLTKGVKEGYINQMNYRVIPHIGNMKLTTITATHIDKIIVSLLHEGKSPSTIRNVFFLINSCFDYAVRKKIVASNPCLYCEPLPKDSRKPTLHTFSDEEVKRFLRDALTKDYSFEVKGHKSKHIITKGGDLKEVNVKTYTQSHTVSLQFKVYFYLAIYGGFRRGELIGLNWEDIDFDEQTINIDESVSISKEGQYIKAPKTVAGYRTIKLPAVCFSLLSQLKAEEKMLCLKLGTAWKGFRDNRFDQNPVFIQWDTGERMNVQTPTKKFRQILDAYNKTVPEEKKLPIIRLHDLRHTNASHLVASGVDILTVAKRLGHSKISVTLDKYSHALPENDEKAVATLERQFG